MRRPLTEGAHWPRCIHVRGNLRWRDRFPSWEELGIEVAVRNELPTVNEAYAEYLRLLKEVRSRRKIQPTAEQAAVERTFPAIARWVQGYGHIEIGDQAGFGFVVRALDDGGVVFEDDKSSTLAEALAALEKELARWFAKEEAK